MDLTMAPLREGQAASRWAVTGHAICGVDEVVAVHLTRHVPDPSGTRLPDGAQHSPYLAGIIPADWGFTGPRQSDRGVGEWKAARPEDHSPHGMWLHNCDAVMCFAEPDGYPAGLVLDTVMRTYSARAGAVVIDRRTCLVGLRTHRSGTLADAGYTVTVTADQPDRSGSVELYPSAMLGWVYWWLERVFDLSDQITHARLPPPPLALDLVENGEPSRLRLEQPNRTQWHHLPPAPTSAPW